MNSANHNTTPKITVVIPVYSCSDALHELVQRLFQLNASYSLTLNVILVDDGSPEKIWNDLKNIKKKYSQQSILLIKLAENYGQPAATLCGIKHACGDYIVTMDADLQHSPEDIPLLLNKLINENLDVVYAQATEWQNSFRRYSSIIYRILLHPLGTPFIKGSSFRVINKKFLDTAIANNKRPFYFIDTLLKDSSKLIGSIPVNYTKGVYSKSSYSTSKLIKEAWRNISYSFIGFRIYFNLKKTRYPEYKIKEII